MSTRPFQNNAVIGQRGVFKWEADQRPGNWREMINLLYPDGDAPLTAMTALLASEATDDYIFNWWGKGFPKQFGEATGIYTDQALSSAVSGTLAEGDVIYVKVAADTAKHFTRGKQVLLRELAGDINKDTNFKCLDVTLSGANSYLVLKLIGSDNGVEDCDWVVLSGNINPQGGLIPVPVSYNPVKFYNHTQIFRNSLQMTRTAMKTRLRTPEQYQEAKREALELHSVEMERAFWHSVRSETINAENGEPETTTDGIITAIKRENPNNIFRYNADAEFAGKTWEQGAEDWLEKCMEELHRYGTGERMFFAGSNVLRTLNRLAKLYGNIQLAPGETKYGLAVTYWITSQGPIAIKTNPLWNHDPSMRSTMVAVIPSKMKFRFIDDTFFKADESDKKNTNSSRDGKYEEFVTEAGLEYDHLEGYGIFTGFGLDNELTP
jgi:hypothetical protein